MRQVRLPMKNIKLTENRIRASVKTDDEYNKLKKSIKQLGMSNPIIVTTNLELIAGFWRLKSFIELHNAEPDNEAFMDIPTLIVNGKEESEDLKIDFVDGRSTDYMRDTAVDRLDMVYESIEFRDKPLHEFLEISEVELEHRLEIGQALRKGEFPEDITNKYIKGNFTHSFLYSWKKQQEVELLDDSPEESLEPEESIKFDINKWL